MGKNFLNITPESGNGNQEVTVNAKEEVNIEGTQFYWIDAGSMDPIIQGNHETTIGSGYFLNRVELIQLHKERFHIYLS